MLSTGKKPVAAGPVGDSGGEGNPTPVLVNPFPVDGTIGIWDGPGSPEGNGDWGDEGL